MADVSVNYDLKYSPNPLLVDLALSISDNKINVSLKNVPSVLVAAAPHYSADLGSDVLSTLCTPIANAITLGLGAFAGNVLNGKSFDVYSIPEITYAIGSESVKLKPGNLKLSPFNEMLMLEGTLDLQ
jgi:hypothetical protein